MDEDFLTPIQPPHSHSELEDTGERFLPAITRSATGLEHFHRYLLAARLVRGQRVLDVACGEGYGAWMLAQAAASVHAVDVDARTVDCARAKYGEGANLHFHCADCGAVPLGDGEVDWVVSFETIEHIADQRGFLDEVARVLTPGGVLLVSSPNKTPYNLRHVDNEFHEEELEQEELRALLEERFAHVAMGQQQALFVSLFSAERPTPLTFFERHQADGAFHHSQRLDALTYTIAVASGAPVAGLPSSALLDSTFDGKAHRFHEHSAVYEIRDPGVYERLAELEAAAAAGAAEAVARAAAAEKTALAAAAPAPAGEVEEPVPAPGAPAGEVAAPAPANDEPAPSVGPAPAVEEVEKSASAAPSRPEGDAQDGVRQRVGQRLVAHGKVAVRGLGLRRNPLEGAAGPSNTMQPLPRRILAAAARVASRAALWGHRLRPGVARSLADTRGLFDPGYYRRRYYDISELSDSLCAIHYAVHGWREGRRPGRLFDPDFYLSQYPDVRAANMNPLLHYVRHGAEEWRAPTLELQVGQLPADDKVWQPTTEAGAAPGEVGGGTAGQALAVDHWTRFESFRAYIDGRRREARKAWAPDAPRLVRCTLDQLEETRRGIDAELRLSSSPRASIVIPVHDELQVTLECLQSIADQTTGEYEVVVVDDASSATTARCLSGFRGLRYLRNESQRGFGPTCNRGVEAAKGEVVVLLNSDTQVASGWLEPLLERLADPEIGMVGGKLLFPEGALQEAGGRIRFDGAGEMVGLFEDPGAPQFSCARPVDYVSAACAAMRRADFRRLGGFDDLYAPAYCEDTDLCLQVQEAGMKVLFEPRSVVVHHLSKTTRGQGQRNKVARARRNQELLQERWGERLEASDAVRLLAFYLPQFHAIPENDRWWGEGFTEWHNVAKARPRFSGHRQPRRPADLGYYDLSTPGLMRRQAELAQRYGVHGFAFYYYRLGGRRILEAPLEQVRGDPSWSMPFAVCWANENWTRQWDGQARHILLQQEYGDAEDDALIDDFRRYFEHPAYLRVNGAPLLLVYNPLEVPDSRRTISRWRESCRRHGVGEIYVVAVESHRLLRMTWDPVAAGFDASVEFPPHEAGQPIDLPSAARDPDYKGVVHDYRRVVEAFCTRELPSYKRFRCVMPGWDNTARRKDDSHVFVNAGPAEYQTWLEFALDDTRSHLVGDERLVFVNAWNEWAEAAYLEPDTTYGHGFLEATRNALQAERVRS